MKKNVAAMLCLSSLVGTAFAGTMGEVKTCPDASCMPWFVEFGTGASFSNSASINYHPSYNIWPVPTTTYDGSLGTVPIYMAGIGYTVSPLLKIDASYSYRGIYKYAKHFEYLNNGAGNNSAPNTRYFNLTSNSLMFSATLYAKGLEGSHPELMNRLVKEIDGYGYIQPIIGGGIGVSYNTVTNFHTIIDNTYWMTNAKQDSTFAAFAWQLNAGLDWQVTERFSFDVGYRYFNAGRFNSADACINRINSTTGSFVTPAWSPNWQAILSANEVYFTAKVAF
jgi:hypothetical protein